MKDDKIVDLLREGKRSIAFSKLYKGYSQVEKLILSKGGTKEDAKDIFQDSLIIFYQKAKHQDFKLSAAISTYLYSVCRLLWKDQLIKRQKSSTHIVVEALDISEQNEFQNLIEKEHKFQQIEKVLMEIGESCLKLLMLFYYQKLSMKSIAQKMGFSSDKVAKNQKYKCIERAKQQLKNVPSYSLVNSDKV